jgi:hypothetical protein
MLDVNIKVLERIGSPGKHTQGLGQTELWHVAHWSSSAVELKRRIEKLLLVNSMIPKAGPLTEYAGWRIQEGLLG